MAVSLVVTTTRDVFVEGTTKDFVCFIQDQSFLSSLLKSSSLPRIVKYSAKVTVEEVAYRGVEQNGLYYWLTRLDFSIQKWVNNKSVWIGMAFMAVYFHDSLIRPLQLIIHAVKGNDAVLNLTASAPDIIIITVDTCSILLLAKYSFWKSAFDRKKSQQGETTTATAIIDDERERTHRACQLSSRFYASCSFGIAHLPEVVPENQCAMRCLQKCFGTFFFLMHYKQIGVPLFGLLLEHTACSMLFQS
jgi:hypothetical protein